MPNDASIQTTNRWVVWATATFGIATIGCVDFYSGVELRVFPLYYAPISLVSWHFGRAGAVFAATLSALSWLASNALAGLQFSHPGLWIANTLVQAASFATVGLLIATLKDALMRERWLSRIDPISSLLNSRAFHEEATRSLALCRRKGRPVTLAYIDLDNFKAVNDTVGHQAGDRLLRSVALLLRASTRPSDLCARLGGDEFVVLLPEVDQDEASAALERIRLQLSATAASDAYPVTASIGAVTFMSVPESLQQMISAADSRMYAAKAAGKNRLRLEIAGGAAG
jgi:diguanylate cyclase (GGDEF)-like protein